MTDFKRQKKSLLDDDGDGDADGADLGIRVNKAYAARFEHNKRREELHRLQAKYPEEAEKLARKIAREAAKAAGEESPPRGEDDDDSSDDEEDDGEIPMDTEAKIFETLLRIRSQDPAIYQKDVKFFDDAEENGEVEGGEGADGKKISKKDRPLFLKDLIAKQALEYGPEASSSEDEAEGERKGAAKARNPKVYDVEQENLRKAFLEAAGEAEGEGADGGVGGVLQLRSKGQAHGDGAGDSDGAAEVGEDAGPKKAKKGKKSKGDGTDGKFQQLIEAYFGSGEELNPDDNFLKEYIVNKGWVDRDDDYVPSYREVVGGEDGGEEGVDDEEDEAYLRQVDAFEATYNFRFEEPGADRITTHPRNIEGTVRKPDEKRKRQRDSKKQRLEAAEEAGREELKRLKNLKKQEIENKLDKLRQVAGTAAPAAASLDEVLEGDFDPEEWDKKMAAAFDDSYYDAEEEDLEGLQDDLDVLGDMRDSEEEEEEDGEGEAGARKPLRFKTLQKKLKEVDALSEEPEDGEGGEGGGKARPDPEAMARQRAELQRLLEEYYKLDYEDNVGGIKTRFRYKEVPASTFGLSVDDILRLDEQSLNQVVGMKRLAPYREDQEKLRPNYKALQAVKGDMANAKNPRRTYKKREWQKGTGGGGRQGGQWWRGKDKAGEAAGAGPGSAAGGGEGRSAADGDKQQQQHPHADGGQHKERTGKKRRERPDGDGGTAGPGPGSEAAGRGDGPSKKHKGPGDGPRDGNAHDNGHKPMHAHQGKGQGRHKPQPQQPADPQQARLASYAIPTLKKDSGGPHGDKKRKRGGEGQGQGGSKGGAQEQNDGPQLTRAQRKNLKRSQKRAEKRQTETPASDG